VATRSIITHQPEVSCDMCGRRLLRGERPDVFLDAGESRTVCELCAPRAAGEGWLRAADAPAAASAPSPRVRRRRSLLDRLRQRGEDAGVRLPAPDPFAGAPKPAERDLFDVGYAGSQVLVAERPLAEEREPAAEPGADEAEAGSPIALAVEVFNASECSARVAGIARALGEPSATVRVAGEDRVSVVVAWELCWYRYEVDLSEAPARIAQVADGSELDQLEEADRLRNARTNERGELALL
jgi:hypothetical protein